MTKNNIDNNLTQLYTQVPASLLNMPGLKCVDAIAHSFYFDRLQKSIKENMVDSDGTPYIHMANKELAGFIGCSVSLIPDAKQRLQDAGLIHVKHRGLGKSDIIYVYACERPTPFVKVYHDVLTGPDYKHLPLECKVYHAVIGLDSLNKSHSELSRAKAANALGISPRTISRYNTLLMQAGLITKYRRGLNKTDITYYKLPTPLANQALDRFAKIDLMIARHKAIVSNSSNYHLRC